MSVCVVAGCNWGDEGKGRIVDYLSVDADVVVRYQGGTNAGHTIVNEWGTFRLHLIPSGIFRPTTVNVLGPGMVIDLEALNAEISELQARGIDTTSIKVSDRSTICFPYHRQEDVWEEERLKARAYGSTRRGIAPAYSDRYLKKAIQVGELLYPEELKARLREIVQWKHSLVRGLYGKRAGVSFDEIWDWIETFGRRAVPLIADTTLLLEEARREDKRILFEGQLGSLRDVYFGTFPFTTSSNCMAAFAPVGGGLFGALPDRVVGVSKAFSSCVGAGPFVTEMLGPDADSLREIAKEYGASTGRPRRIGHFDCVASRYGATVQGCTEIALTKLDSLTGRHPLLLCTEYEYKGQRITRFPLNPVLEKARPVYKSLDGWHDDISQVREFHELPKAAREYVLEIERQLGFPIRYVSVGPERDAIIDREKD